MEQGSQQAQAATKDSRFCNLYGLGMQSKLLVDPNVTLLQGERGQMFLSPEKHLIRAYINADADAIGAMSAGMPQTELPVIAESIGSQRDTDKIFALLRDTGWEPYARLQYLIRRPASEEQDVAMPIDRAHQSDCEALLRLLNGIFDPCVSHLPESDTLAEWIDCEHVWCIRADGEIAAMAIFRMAGKKVKLLEQLCISANFRRRGAAKELLRHEFYLDGGASNYALWHICGNESADRLYAQAGFSKTDKFVSIFKWEG